MPDRRNRPRIAGQRRPTDHRPPTDNGTPETPLEDSTTEPALDEGTTEPALEDSGTEMPLEGVTPATAKPQEADSDEEAGTLSDASAAPAKGSEGAQAAADRGQRLTLLLSVAMSVLIVLILALAGVLGVKAWNGRQAEDARGDAAAAGRKAAETALSYDHRSLDKSFAAARATMTPDFATKFDDTAKVAGELATKTKATVRAEVREVGVRDGDANRVTLVIFVNQTTTSTITQGKPRVDLNRTRFTMVRNGDQWLVQEIAGL